MLSAESNLISFLSHCKKNIDAPMQNGSYSVALILKNGINPPPDGYGWMRGGRV
ncbi:MAG: hypothetical protein IKQ70_04315 [Bacteroidales bacterium]|nr:hypothetical protein [Bacteroidales bacterium]